MRALDNIILKLLTEEGNALAKQIQSNASWSSTIPSAVSVGNAQKTATGFEIVIKIDGKKAPEAAAFEYGSGIHRTKGNPGTYKIKPKNAGALAFVWNPANPSGAMRSKKFAGFADDGRWMFLEVDHPGVEARPFIAPALVNTKRTFKQKVGRMFIEAYRKSVKRVEIIGI